MAAAALLGGTSAATAASLTWNGGLPGSWDTTSANWSGSTWSNTNPDDAVFNNVSGTITLTEAITGGSLGFYNGGAPSGGHYLTLTGANLSVASVLSWGGYYGPLGNGGVDSIDQAYNQRLTIQAMTLNISGDATVRRGMLYFNGATVNVGGKITAADAWNVFRSDNSTVTATGGIDLSGIASQVELYGGTVTTPFIKVGNAAFAGLGGLAMGSGVRLVATQDNADFIQVYNDGNVGSRAGATISGGGMTIDTAGRAVTVTTALNGDALTKAGNGTLTLSGGNSYGGVTEITAGTLVAASNNALGAGGWSSATMSNIRDGATLALQGGVSLDEHFHVWGSGVGGLGAVRSLSGNNALTIGGNNGNGFALRSNVVVGVDADTLTMTGFYEDGGAYGLTKVGNGTLVLTARNAHTGGTTVNAGTLSVAGIGGDGGLRGAITVNAGATLVTAGDGTGLGYNGQVSSVTINGGLLKAASGIMSHIWNISGGITMTGGELQVNDGASDAAGQRLEWNWTALTTLASANQAVVSGRVHLRDDTSYSSWNITVADGAAAVDLLVSAAITQAGGAVGLTKSGAGTLKLTGASTYTGVTVLAGGVVNAATFADNGAVSSLGAGTGDTDGGSIGLLFRGGVLQYTGSVAQTTNRAIRLSTTGGGGTIDASGSVPSATLSFTSASMPNWWENPGERTLTLTGSNTGDNTLAAGVNDTGGTKINLTKNGVGTWVLAGAGNYLGVTNVNAGMLVAANSTALGAGGLDGNTMTWIRDGGTLALKGDISLDEHLHVLGAGVGGLGALRNLSGANTITQQIGLDGDTTIGVDAGTLTITQKLYGDGALNASAITKVGSGTLLLSGDNTYSGGTTVNGGTLALAGVQGVLDGAVTINSGGTVSVLGGQYNRYWDVASTRINAGGVLTGEGHSHVRNLTLAGGELAGTSPDGTYGGWVFDDPTTVTGGGTSVISASEVVFSNGNLTVEAGSTLSFTGSVRGGYINPTLGAGARFVNAAAANTSLSLGALALNGGELAATSAPASNLGNYQLRGDVTVGGSAMSTISADVRVVSNETRTFTVGDVDGGAGVDLLLSGKIGHHNGAAWGYFTKAGAGTLKINGSNEIGGIAVSAGRLVLEDTGIGGMWATGLTNNAATELRVTTGSVTATFGIGGSGALTKTGNGTLTLQGNSSATGGLIVDGGTVIANRSPQDNGTFSLGPGAIIINNGGTLISAANWTTGSPWNGNSVGSITVNAGGTWSIPNLGQLVGNGLFLNGGTISGAGENGDWGGLLLRSDVTVGGAAVSAISTDTAVEGTRTITVGAGSRLDFSGKIHNQYDSTAGLTKTGDGILVLSGNNTYTGNTTVAGGTLILDSAGSTYAYNGGTITINGGSTLRIRGQAYTFNGKTIAFGAAGGGTLDAIATGGGGTYLTGGNTITTAGGAQNTISGTKLSGANQGINLNSQTLTFEVAVGADPALPNLDFAGTLWNTGNLTKSGNGILLLSGNNEYTGATTVNAGTLSLRGAYASASFAVSSGAVLDLAVASGARDSATTTFSGAGTLRKTGSGELIWGSGTATFALGSGALIDVQGGRFVGGSFGNENWSSNLSDLNVEAGAVFDTVEANVRVNKITGGGTIRTGYGGAGYQNLTIGVDDGSSTFAGVIADADATGNLVKAGTGAITLSGTNTYSGSTTVNGGTLKFTTLGTTGGSSLGSSDRTNPGNLLLNGAVTLEYAGSGEDTSRSFTVSGTGLSLTSTGSGALKFTSAAQVAFAADGNAARQLKLGGTNTGDNTFAASLAGTPDEADKIKLITKDGVGTWILDGPANRFRGDVRVELNSGTLGLTSGAVGTASGDLISINAGSTLRWEAGNTDDLSARLFFLPYQSSTDATVAITSGLVVFANAFGSGSGLTLVKTGGGTLELDADQTEIDGVRVTAGRLTAKTNGALGINAASVTGGTLSISQGVSVANAIDVSNGGTLAGKGSTGAVTVAAGGILSPGSSPGVLTHSNLSLAGGAIINWEVYDANAAAGVGYDRLVVNGDLDLTGASSANKIVLKIISLSALDANGDPLNFGASSIRTFQFGRADQVILNNGVNISDVFAFDLSQFTYTGGASSNAGLWSINWDSGTKAITLTAVPEPSTYGLGLGALALAAAALRRRRRKQTP